MEKLKRYGGHVLEETPVECIPLRSIGLPKAIDMFFLDVEGAEFAVLKSMDFQKTCVRLLSIEGGLPNSEVGKLLASKGYGHYGQQPHGADQIWVNSKPCK